MTNIKNIIQHVDVQIVSYLNMRLKFSKMLKFYLYTLYTLPMKNHSWKNLQISILKHNSPDYNQDYSQYALNSA